MPTYDYECTKCGCGFEKFQPITAKPVKKCPGCGGSVKRLIGTGAALIFKGSGFYATDYRSSEYKDSAKKDRPPAEAPAESKPAESKSE